MYLCQYIKCVINNDKECSCKLIRSIESCFICLFIIVFTTCIVTYLLTYIFEFKIHVNLIFTVIRVGYEDRRYAINEGHGSVELCVVTHNLIPVDRPFVLRATPQSFMAGV